MRRGEAPPPRLPPGALRGHRAHGQVGATILTDQFRLAREPPGFGSHETARRPRSNHLARALVVEPLDGQGAQDAQAIAPGVEVALAVDPLMLVTGHLRDAKSGLRN